MDILTEEEKRVEIDREISRSYPKMLKDFKRITSYNHIKFEDLLAFVLSEFVTKKSIDYQYKVCCIDKKLVNYIGKSMSLNLRSSTSPFWAKYRRTAYNSRGIYLVEYDEFGMYELPELQDPDLRIEDLNPRECMHVALEKLDFYHRQLVEDHYIRGMSYKKMRDHYGITLSSLRKDVAQGVKLIQQHCKQFLV